MAWRFRSRSLGYSVASLLSLGLYKLAENWALNWVQAQIDSGVVRLILDYLPLVTWAFAAIGLILLGTWIARSTAAAQGDVDSRIHKTPRTKQPDTEHLELLERKFEANKVFARTKGKVVELDIDAYDYYVQLPDEQKKYIAELLPWASGYQFSTRYFVDAVNPKQRRRNRLDDFIQEGNDLVHTVSSHKEKSLICP